MGKSRSSYIKLLYRSVVSHWVVFCVAIFFTSATMANPVLNNVAAGNATVNQTATTTTVNQTSQKAILNWHSFNIGAGEHTHFNQPTNGVAFNRISASQGASQIFGHLSATGQIILMNPAGVHFNSGSFVNVGGLIATTANMSDSDFMNGYYNFNQPSTISGASISNAGQIIAADHGLIALVGGNVTNTGHIQANLGNVVLASGNTFTMNFDGTGLINFVVDSAGTNVTNTGSLIADAGQILVTAKAASGVVDNIINMAGVAEAKSVYEKNGTIIISGDPNAGVVRVAADIKADGGEVQITGHNILLDEGTSIDVSGEYGGGNIYVGGNYKGEGPLPNANAVVMMPDVSLLANALSYGNGGEVILWSDNVTKAYGHIEAKGGSLGGDGGFIETSSKNYLDVNGISIDTSAALGAVGTWLLDPTNLWIALNLANAQGAGMPGADTSADTSGPSPFEASGPVNDSFLGTGTIETALATSDVTVQTTNAAGAGAGNITIVDAITWTSANSLSFIADNNIVFNAGISGVNGSLNLTAVNAANSITTGAGGTINVANFDLLQGQWSQIGTLPSFNVTNSFQINSSVLTSSTDAQFIRAAGGDGSAGSPYQLVDIYGLQGVQSNSTTLGYSYILNNDINATSTTTWDSGAGYISNGTFTGYTGTFNGNSKTISNLYINRPTTDNIGLFGRTGVGSSISNLTITSANITGDDTVGILAGFNRGSITNVTVSGSVTGAGTTGSDDVGGLIGENNFGGTISSSSSSATVTASDNSSPVGGLVGNNFGTISNASASGNVISGDNSDAIGGLVGLHEDGSITNSFSTGNVTSGMNSSQIGGLIGDSDDSVTASYSTGNVTVGTGSEDIGGFAGNNEGSITTSYSTGTVTAPSPNFDVGGFVGLNDSTITLSYTTSNVISDNGEYVGGFVGDNSSGGTIQNAYSTGSVTGSGTVNRFGGFAGSNSSTIENAYSIGFVSGTGTNIGGFVGINGTLDTITNSFWDTATSGQATGFNGDATNITNLTGGCFLGGACANGGTLNMSDQSSYTGWTFPTTWSIISGNQSYPYLTAFYPTTPRIIAGDTSAAGGTSIAIHTAGAIHDRVNAGDDGSFYFLEGLNAISNIDLSIADNTPIVVYVEGGTSAITSNTPTSGGSLSNTTALDFPNANTLYIGNAGSQTISTTNLVSAAGGTPPASLLYTGSGNDVTLNAGVNLIISANTTFNLAGNLSLSNAGTSTVSGILTGTGGLTKAGAGMLILAGANTYTGATTINAGTLQLGAGASLSSSTTVTLANIASAIFDINDNTVTIGGLTGGGGAGGNVDLGSGTLTINQTGNATYSGVMSGTGGLTKAGAGTLTLDGANTFSGTTTINAGTLTVDNAAGLGTSAGNTVVNTSATLLLNGQNIGGENITLNGATLTSSAASTVGGTITLGGTSNTINSNSGQLTLDVIEGPAALTISGAGSVALNDTIGLTTDLSSLTVSTTGGNTLGTTTIDTVGNQTYSTTTTFGTNSTLTSTGSGSNTISFSGGLNTGGNTVNLVGSNAGGSYTFNVAGSLTGAGTLNATAPAASSGNTLSLATGNAQTFNITATDNGNYTSSTVTGLFTDIESLMGGTATNTFIFANNALMTGSINGGSSMVGVLTATNTLDFSAWPQDLFATLVGDIFTGTVNIGNGAATGATVTTFSNINQLNADYGFNNIIQIPTGKSADTITYTAVKTGFIGDPLFFNGWLGVVLPSGTIVPVNDIAADIMPRFPEDPLYLYELTILDIYNKVYDDKKVTINPFCQAVSSGFGG